MRDELIGELVRHHRRRQAGRAAALALLLAIAGALAWHFASTPAPRAPAPPPPPAEAPTYESIDLTMVSDDRGIVARLAVPPRSVADEVFIDDDQLFALLAQAGQPAGLLRAHGKTIVLW